MACDLSIAIVTFNSRTVIAPCLESIQGAVGGLSVEVIVVDSASSDGTLECVASYPGVTVIRNTDNRGFARACNAALRTTSGRHLLLLNPDTRLTAGALEGLVAALERDPSVGVGDRTRGEPGQMSRQPIWVVPSASARSPEGLPFERNRDS